MNITTCCFGVVLTALEVIFCIFMWTEIFHNEFGKKQFKKHACMCEHGQLLRYTTVADLRDSTSAQSKVNKDNFEL